ncbi:4-coumarate--CoA ligase 1-like [Vanessa cardui]|uniref:4-coumarate--CoA ligase 1-like n=1 Tax=Vanessa cardui TaxID=171605 RepID=UPI001F1327D5|nr:4-coumarate--CoA ligase 1-like [Vanessa cardui]
MFKIGIKGRHFGKILSINGRMKHLWTMDKIVQSPYKDVFIPDMPISEYMWQNLDRWSDKTAVICGITDRRYTYKQLYHQSRVFGANLRKKIKIQDGDAVAIMLPNIPEYLSVVLGTLTAGGLVTTLNPVYTAHEIERQIKISNPKVVVAVRDTEPIIKEALKMCKLNVPVVVIDVDQNRPEGTVSFKEFIEDNNTDLDILKEVKCSADDVSLLLYSSGTTGLPKGVELTHRNIIANCEQLNSNELKMFTDTTDSNQDTILAYLPMFHSYGLCTILIHKLSVGLKLVTLPRFQSDIFVNTLNKYDFTTFSLVPPTVLFLAKDPNVKTKHFTKLKNVVVGASPTPMADIERFLNKVNHDIQFSHVYGLTETSPLALAPPINFKDYSSVGFAIPNCELRVVDDQLNNLGPNELGELLIKGPNITRGYKNNPEANEKAFVNKEWLRTGDLVKINEDGSVVIADRIKEIIKVNAYQVPPAELENVIKEHPAVFDVAVIGIPDEKTGEKPKAFVVLNKGFSVSEKEIMEHVSAKVAPFKRLKEVVFVDSIPKNSTGKTMRRLLH